MAPIRGQKIGGGSTAWTFSCEVPDGMNLKRIKAGRSCGCSAANLPVQIPHLIQQRMPNFYRWSLLVA